MSAHTQAPPPTAHRRGAIGVAAVIALVFAQLLIVGVIITGAREQDTTVQRLDTLRAFYAAEGGMNMAIREMMNLNDDDGDGTVGSISNDNNASNDPQAGNARVYVTTAVSGPTTTLVSRARSGQARRQLSAVIE